MVSWFHCFKPVVRQGHCGERVAEESCSPHSSWKQRVREPKRKELGTRHSTQATGFATHFPPVPSFLHIPPAASP